MKKLFKTQRIQLIILLTMVVLSILEELLIGEGGYGVYLQLPQHKILRFIIRGVYALILFGIGYKGLLQLGVRWVLRIWLFWYGIAIIMVSIRIILNLEFKFILTNNIFIFLIPFYSLLLTPFPYFFLWMLYNLYQPGNVNSKS